MNGPGAGHPPVVHKTGANDPTPRTVTAEGLREAFRHLRVVSVLTGAASVEGYVKADVQELLAALTPSDPLDVEKLAKSWEATAEILGERVFAGDPAATLATIRTLQDCASDLRRLSSKADSEEPHG